MMDTTEPVNASPLAAWVMSPSKRLMDRLTALVLTVPAVTLLIPLTIWSAVSLRANPIFRQTRVGFKGRSFEMLKLRTLPVHVPEELDRAQLVDHHEPAGVAAFLRKSHLDELPQVLHVLSGKMSLVGPRPMIQPIVDSLVPEFRNYRELARPGLTGLWQISLCGERRFEFYDPLDVAYLETASPILDLKILYHTVGQVWGAKRLGPKEIESSLGIATHSDTKVSEPTNFENQVAVRTAAMIHPTYRVD